ncbi:MAG TPA: hypothetical protein VGG71_16280 [Chitinophagaceae bacterium]
MAYINTSSTISLQTIADRLTRFPDLNPILNIAGSQNEPVLQAANDVMNAIFEVPFPHKWAEIILPQFYTNSYQQDYAGVYLNAFPGHAVGSSVTNLSWLERGIVIDINNASLPKPWRNVECGRQLPQATASLGNSYSDNPLFLVNFFPNNTLYYGTWGAPQTGNNTFGNNPLPGSVYTQPLGAGSQPSNPITQIQDANGNFLVLTTYGTTGSIPPIVSSNSSPGLTVNDGSCIWTVVDPYGQGFRILDVPTQGGVVWQFNLVGQMLPTQFNSLSQTLFPLPDQFEPNFRQGMVAQLYRYSPEAKIREKFKTEWELWLRSLVNLRAKQDRETEENSFEPERGIMGNINSRKRMNAGYPFLGPVPGSGY